MLIREREVAVASALILVAALASFLGNVIRSKFVSQKEAGRTWAWRSLLVAALAFVAFGVFSGREDDEQARVMGFSSGAEMREAKSHGVADPEQWTLKRAELDAQKAEQAAAAARQEAAERARQARIEASKANAAAQKARKEARFKCLSPWDGSMTALVEAVQTKMRDPASFEHISTAAGAVSSNGTQYVEMEFRARNLYGGMNVQRAKATIDNARCLVQNWEFN